MLTLLYHQQVGGWAVGRAGGRAEQSRGQADERAGERASEKTDGGWADERTGVSAAGVRDILTYGKWLLVKIPPCPLAYL